MWCFSSFRSCFPGLAHEHQRFLHPPRFLTDNKKKKKRKFPYFFLVKTTAPTRSDFFFSETARISFCYTLLIMANDVIFLFKPGIRCSLALTRKQLPSIILFEKLSLPRVLLVDHLPFNGINRLFVLSMTINSLVISLTVDWFGGKSRSIKFPS